MLLGAGVRTIDPHHRHFSHLVGLHPFSLITQADTPELFAACERSLELRGDESTGWSMGWKVNAWARLKDGDRIEMLLQSHEGFLNFLPALPAAWKEGHITGLRARGGFELDLRWSNGRLDEARLRSLLVGPCRIESVSDLRVSSNGENIPIFSTPNGIEFETQAGEVYFVKTQ